MKIYRLPSLAEVTALPDGACAALGNFDGVHLGHKALLREAAKKSPCAVWTFSVPEKAEFTVPLLTEPTVRLRMFYSCGIEYAVTEDFDAVRNLSCEEFVRDVLHEKLHIGSVVCGYNHRFGKGGTGTAQDMQALCRRYGMECTVVPPVTCDGVAVSSSIIREKLAAGDVRAVARLLGRPFSLSSPVVHGKSLGSAYQIPTVNQKIPKRAQTPLFGVYATAVTVDGEVYAGATNVGVRPTLNDGNEVNCETNIIGFSGDLYGREIRVDFLEFVRNERKFEDKDELFSQIRKDIEACRKIFADLSQCSERNPS